MSEPTDIVKDVLVQALTQIADEYAFEAAAGRSFESIRQAYEFMWLDKEIQTEYGPARVTEVGRPTLDGNTLTIPMRAMRTGMITIEIVKVPS